MRLGTCGRCQQTRYLVNGFCPACQAILKESRAAQSLNDWSKIVSQFAGELERPDEEIWKELGL